MATLLCATVLAEQLPYSQIDGTSAGSVLHTPSKLSCKSLQLRIRLIPDRPHTCLRSVHSNAMTCRVFPRPEGTWRGERGGAAGIEEG